MSMPGSSQSVAATSVISPSSTMQPETAESSTQFTVLVTAATGDQGFAVARTLLASPTPVLKVQVRCLVRNPADPVAQSLQALGAYLYEGDLNSVSILRTATKECNAVFLHTQINAGDEEQQARNILTAASDEGVRHIVASTSPRVEEFRTLKVFQESPTHPMLGFFRGKAAVQDLLYEWANESSGSDTERFYTILQPAWSMTDFLPPDIESFWGTRVASDGILTTAFTHETKVPLIAGRDVGCFAAQAFQDVARGGNQGQRWNNKIVRLAGEELTMEEIAAIMGEVGGKKLEVEYRPDSDVRKQRETNAYVFVQWWEMLDGSGVDLNVVRKFGLQTTTFRELLEENRERLGQALGIRARRRGTPIRSNAELVHA